MSAVEPLEAPLEAPATQEETPTVNETIAIMHRDYGWNRWAALFHIAANYNGHTFGKVRQVETNGRRGWMARCTVAGCGASVWEHPDLAGGHGAGPAVPCLNR